MRIILAAHRKQSAPVGTRLRKRDGISSEKNRRCIPGNLESRGGRRTKALRLPQAGNATLRSALGATRSLHRRPERPDSLVPDTGRRLQPRPLAATSARIAPRPLRREPACPLLWRRLSKTTPNDCSIVDCSLRKDKGRGASQRRNRWQPQQDSGPNRPDGTRNARPFAESGG